jgi:putative hydrolase of the HAD superfamily
MKSNAHIQTLDVIPLLVCFDLGGVLVETCASWEDACVCSGLGLREPQLQERKRSERRAIAREYQLGRITTDDFVERVSVALERVYSPMEVTAIHRSVVKGQVRAATETVELVHSLGFQTAVLSNNNELHWQVVNSFAAVGAIPTRFSSHLLGSLKPDEQIFHRFECLTGTRPSEVLFFDDQVANIVAARRRGWNALLVESTNTMLDLVQNTLCNSQERTNEETGQTISTAASITHQRLQ